MSTLYNKLRAAKSCCKGLNRRCFSDIEGKTKSAFENLQRIQLEALTAPSQELFVAETEAQYKWLFLAAAEQNFFQLKSRVRWATKGDSNTGFFHRLVKSKLSRNVVHYLTDRDGLRVSDKEDMQQMVIRFYSYIQGRSNAAVVPLSPQ